MFPGYSTRLENDLRSIYFKEILKSKGEIKIKIDINVNLYKKRMHQIENTMYLLEQEYTQIWLKMILISGSLSKSGKRSDLGLLINLNHPCFD